MKLFRFLNNLWNFKKELWEYQKYDYSYSLMMFKKAISLQKKDLKDDETLFAQVSRMEFLLTSVINDDYVERAEKELNIIAKSRFKIVNNEYVNLATPEDKANIRLIYELAMKTERTEWDELCLSFKENLRKFWS